MNKRRTNSSSKSQGKKRSSQASEVHKKKAKFNAHKAKFKSGGPAPKTSSDEVRLNKYLAQAGVASRREADKLIESGLVSVNGKVVIELGTKIAKTDVVKFGDHKLRTETPRYVLLNKPKDFSVSNKDLKSGKSVYSLVRKACKEHVYPIGSLDSTSTGLLLFTNDSDLAKRLTHPKHEAEKVYQVSLDQPFKSGDFNKLTEGVQLKEGKFWAKDASYVSKDETGKEIGIEIKRGTAQVVKRMFELLGYKVQKVDRVIFAGLTKKDLPRGSFRHLTEKEIAFLKMN